MLPEPCSDPHAQLELVLLFMVLSHPNEWQFLVWIPSSFVKFHYKYILFYFCWNLLVNYHFPSHLSGIVFAVQFVDCECPRASLCSPYTLHGFLRELKGQIFCTKSLILLLILMGCFIWGFSVALHPANTESGISVFDVAHSKLLPLPTGAHPWVVIWCSLSLQSCSLYSLALCARRQALD